MTGPRILEIARAAIRDRAGAAALRTIKPPRPRENPAARLARKAARKGAIRVTL